MLPTRLSRSLFCSARGIRRYAETARTPAASVGPPRLPKPKTNDRAHHDDPLDGYIDIYQRIFLQPGAFDGLASVDKLYAEYRANAGHVLEHALPYEAYPESSRRSDTLHSAELPETEGDGVVLVVHVLQGLAGHVEKMSVCSGFAVGTVQEGPVDPTVSSDTIVTCAHTLEEMHHHLREPFAAMQPSCTFVIPSHGKPKLIAAVQSSMPRSDLVVMKTVPSRRPPLTSLPLSPFPLAVGSGVLTHLFGSPDVPDVVRARNRRQQEPVAEPLVEEAPISWLEGKAWRRWGRGELLGYRSYTGQEVEAGTSSQLPHLLTSILPTQGSSGGPILDASTGAVVGMTSGRRMDNRVEGERGWGAAAEGIFEMFALPGFVPASRRK